MAAQEAYRSADDCHLLRTNGELDVRIRFVTRCRQSKRQEAFRAAVNDVAQIFRFFFCRKSRRFENEICTADGKMLRLLRQQDE